MPWSGFAPGNDRRLSSSSPATRENCRSDFLPSRRPPAFRRCTSFSPTVRCSWANALRPKFSGGSGGPVGALPCSACRGPPLFPASFPACPRDTGTARRSSRQQLHQVPDGDAVQVPDRECDLLAAEHVDGALRQPAELLLHLRPRHRAGMEPLVVGLLPGESTAVLQGDGEPAGVFVRETPRENGIRNDRDAMEQRLDVVPCDPFRFVLLGHRLPVERGNGYHVLQAVIGFLLVSYDLLAPPRPPADDQVRHVEDVDPDPVDLPSREPVLPQDLDHPLEGRLRVDLGVVLLEDRSRDTLQVLPRPVDLEVAGDRLAPTLVPLEHFPGAREVFEGTR